MRGMMHIRIDSSARGRLQVVYEGVGTELCCRGSEQCELEVFNLSQACTARVRGGGVAGKKNPNKTKPSQVPLGRILFFFFSSCRARSSSDASWADKTIHHFEPKMTSSKVSETVKLRFRRVRPLEHLEPLHDDIVIFCK